MKADDGIGIHDNMWYLRNRGSCYKHYYHRYPDFVPCNWSSIAYSDGHNEGCQVLDSPKGMMPSKVSRKKPQGFS